MGRLARGFEDTQTVADEAREGITGSGRAAKETLHVSGVLIGWGYAVEHKTDSESYKESECKMPEKMGLTRYKRKPHRGA